MPGSAKTEFFCLSTGVPALVINKSSNQNCPGTASRGEAAKLRHPAVTKLQSSSVVCWRCRSVNSAHLCRAIHPTAVPEDLPSLARTGAAERTCGPTSGDSSPPPGAFASPFLPPCLESATFFCSFSFILSSFLVQWYCTSPAIYNQPAAVGGIILWLWQAEEL